MPGQSRCDRGVIAKARVPVTGIHCEPGYQHEADAIVTERFQGLRDFSDLGGYLTIVEIRCPEYKRRPRIPLAKHLYKTYVERGQWNLLKR